MEEVEEIVKSGRLAARTGGRNNVLVKRRLDRVSEVEHEATGDGW